MITSTDDICARLVELHRQRQDLHRAEKSMTYRIRAVCLRLAKGDSAESRKIYQALEGRSNSHLAEVAAAVTEPYKSSRTALRSCRATIEERMRREASSLEVWPYVNAIVGMGPILLASLVGETGNLSNYKTFSRVWKRLGLAIIDGESQRRVLGAMSLAHGFNPSRRATVWVIGRTVLRNQSLTRDCPARKATHDATYYRRCYDNRKDYELSRGLTRGHAHNRAARYMEKKLVRDIWRAWRAATSSPEAG